jgi:hypothetical protein
MLALKPKSGTLSAIHSSCSSFIEQQGFFLLSNTDLPAAPVVPPLSPQQVKTNHLIHSLPLSFAFSSASNSITQSIHPYIYIYIYRAENSQHPCSILPILLDLEKEEKERRKSKAHNHHSRLLAPGRLSQWKMP